MLIVGAHNGDLLTKVQAAFERFDLLEQILCQFFACADGNSRDVVDWLVGVQLAALPARLANRVDDFRFQSQQPEFKYLEQAAWPRADNYNIRMNQTIAPLT
jgi:hypothetical protein